MLHDILGPGFSETSTVEKDKIWYTNWRKLDTGEHLIKKILCITDERKHIITEPNIIIGRWLSHFKHLLNIENERDGNRTEVNKREDARAAHYHRAIQINGSREANEENAE